MRRARTLTCAILLALVATYASALDVPTDAEVLVTDSNSRIVGVGHVVAGVRFDLVLEEGFAGPASLVWLVPDGGVRTIEIVVEDGTVWVDGVDLTTLLPDAFALVRVRLATELGDAWPPDVGEDPPADVPRPAEGERPPTFVDPPGPPAAPPDPPEAGQPEDDPGPPEDGPGPPEEGPGPPDEDPGPPDEDPGRRP